MDKLKTYVQSARAKGYSDDQIRSVLQKAGWQQSRIEAALSEMPAPAPEPAPAPASVTSLQTESDDDVNLDNLNIDSDKPAAAPKPPVPIQAQKPAAPKKPLLKRLLPKAGAGLAIIVGVVIAVSGLKAFSQTRVPGGFVMTKGQIAFSIPGKKNQYDTRVNFKTPDGATHSFVTSTPAGSNNNSRYVAGDGMKVAYYPRNPDMTALDLTDRGSAVTGLITLVVGVIVTGAGVFLLQRQFRRGK